MVFVLNWLKNRFTNVKAVETVTKKLKERINMFVSRKKPLV